MIHILPRIILGRIFFLVRFMAKVFEYKKRIEFRDTDMAGIVHFANFFGFMEEAEHELLRSIGMGGHSELDGQTVSWPRVSAKCDYRQAIKFEEELTLEVSVSRIGTKSVTYEHKMKCDERLIAEGKIVTACCRMVPGEPPKAIPIPQVFIDGLQVFVNG